MNFFNILKSVAVVSGVTGILNLGVSFSFSFLMPAEQYGLYTYWLSIYLILLNLIPFGAVAAATVFRFNIDFNKYKSMLVTSLVYIMPSVLVLVLLFMYLKASFHSPLFDMGYFAPISAFFYSVVMILVSILRVEQKFKVYCNLFIGFVSLVSFLQILAYLLFYSFEAVIYSHTIGMCVVGIVSMIIIIKIFDIKLSLKLFYKSFENTLELLRYGFPVVLSSVLMSFMVVGDKIIIKGLVTSKQMGVYSSVVVICSTTLFLVNNFASAWGGYLVKKLPELGESGSRLFFRDTQHKVFPIFLVLSAFIITVQLIFYSSLYGFKDVLYIYVLSNISLGYCIYGVSKYYVGFMMYYRNNKEVFKATAIGVTAMILFSLFGIGEPVIKISLSVLVGFISQLIYLAFFVNNRIYGEDKYVL